MLRLTLTDGVGPILGRRLLDSFGAPEAVFRAVAADLERIDGIGAVKARRIAASLRESEAALEREAALAEKLGVRIIALGDSAYPALLAQCPDAPLVLYVKGADPCAAANEGQPSFPIAIVGSRHCTPYGIEQAERFSTFVSQSGLTVVSGGARGIDSAAHRAAARANAPTVVVLGCGLSHCYPPENAELFDKVVNAGGAIISELPLSTNPSPENFPARNRIIVGLSLGVLVIEAPRASGALITARIALDEYNREVMAVPGRIDSASSEGSNELIKRGEAAMVTAPGDVVELLEASARHQHFGSHSARYAPAELGATGDRLFDIDTPHDSDAIARASAHQAPPAPLTLASLTPAQRSIFDALEEPATINDLCKRTGLAPGAVQAEALVMEIRRIVARRGSMLARRDGHS